MSTDEDFYRELGHRLRVAMVDARLTQHELAERVGVSTNSVSRHMNGKMLPSATFLRYAQALGVDPSDLIENTKHIGYEQPVAA